MYIIGKWVPKEFNMGRHIAGTGIWDCCGAIHQFSMYCTSAAARLSLAEQKALKAKEEEISRMYKERIIREVKEPWERGITHRYIHKCKLCSTWHKDIFTFCYMVVC